jgi:hypothetical protein
VGPNYDLDDNIANARRWQGCSRNLPAPRENGGKAPYLGPVQEEDDDIEADALTARLTIDDVFPGKFDPIG